MFNMKIFATPGQLFNLRWPFMRLEWTMLISSSTTARITCTCIFSIAANKLGLTRTRKYLSTILCSVVFKLRHVGIGPASQVPDPICVSSLQGGC
jgi:hypothetical protein